MQSKATTVAAYLKELPADRRGAIEGVRRVMLENLDKDFEEGMQYGMIGYYVPHRVYPAGYHCDPKQPLPFAALGSQKGHMSLHLMCTYMDQGARKEFEAAWKKSGKKLDMGKACVRFKKLEDVALDAVAHTIRTVTAARYIAGIEKVLATAKKPGAAKRKPARQVAKKTAKKVAKKAPR